jgi:hypothetical protein
MLILPKSEFLLIMSMTRQNQLRILVVLIKMEVIGIAKLVRITGIAKATTSEKLLLGIGLE